MSSCSRSFTSWLLSTISIGTVKKTDKALAHFSHFLPTEEA